MPLYEYRCDACEHQFEVIQSFSAKPIRKCEKCGGRVQKLISRAGFVLKGGGWYKSDYMPSKPSSVSSEKDGGGSAEKDGGGSAEKEASEPSAKDAAEKAAKDPSGSSDKRSSASEPAAKSEKAAVPAEASPAAKGKKAKSAKP